MKAAVGFVLAAGLLSGCGPREVRSVLVTTDIGTEVDDQWALAHLLLADRDGVIDLCAIVTTHAPNLPAPASLASAREADRLVSTFGSRTPVIAGESSPVPPDRRPRGGAGAACIRDACRSHSPKNRLVVISLGAATDIAEAILLDPGIAERMEVVAMAFDSWPEGGDAWNVRNDPEAFRIILGSAVPLTLGPARTCLGPLNIDMKTAAELTRPGGARGALLLSRLEEWLQREMALSVRTTGDYAWPLWDLITVAHVFGLTETERRRRPRLRDDLSFDLSGTVYDMGWITHVDGKGLFDDLAARLAREPRSSLFLAPTPAPVSSSRPREKRKAE